MRRILNLPRRSVPIFRWLRFSDADHESGEVAVRRLKPDFVLSGLRELRVVSVIVACNPCPFVLFRPKWTIRLTTDSRIATNDGRSAARWRVPSATGAAERFQCRRSPAFGRRIANARCSMRNARKQPLSPDLC